MKVYYRLKNNAPPFDYSFYLMYEILSEKFKNDPFTKKQAINTLSEKKWQSDQINQEWEHMERLGFANLEKRGN